MKFKLSTIATYYSPESVARYEKYGFKFFPRAGRKLLQITDFEPTIDVQLGDILIMQQELGDLIIGEDVIIVFDAPMMDT